MKEEINKYILSFFKAELDECESKIIKLQEELDTQTTELEMIFTEVAEIEKEAESEINDRAEELYRDGWDLNEVALKKFIIGEIVNRKKQSRLEDES